jgi:hypothetical protein
MLQNVRMQERIRIEKGEDKSEEAGGLCNFLLRRSTGATHFFGHRIFPPSCHTILNFSESRLN